MSSPLNSVCLENSKSYLKQEKKKKDDDFITFNPAKNTEKVEFYHSDEEEKEKKETYGKNDNVLLTDKNYKTLKEITPDNYLGIAEEIVEMTPDD